MSTNYIALAQAIVIDTDNNKIRVTVGATTEEVTVASGTYYISGQDADSTMVFNAIETAIESHSSSPTITKGARTAFNINGTSPASIQDEYNSAMAAIRKAEQMLVNCTCHPRDFQFQTYDRYLKAREEREQMLEHLRSVHDYCEVWYWHAVESH